MPTDLGFVVQSLKLERTILLFGAGSSIPSGAPSVGQLQKAFERRFAVSATDYSLSEQAGIIEQKIHDRRLLVEALRDEFKGLKPLGSILNLPLYPWKSIFTTNYDELIEQSYNHRNSPLNVYSSNFDFGKSRNPESTPLFKLHGTIWQDVVDGDRSRLILTDADYDLTEEYRQTLYDRLKSDLAGSTLIIIGHSLADPDIKEIVNRAASLNTKSGGSGSIVLLSYSRDEGRAVLFEPRGITVTFGGIDEFFAEVAKRAIPSTDPHPQGSPISTDPLDVITALRPSTIDAAQAASNLKSDVSRMYNGWPASHSDINAGHTFRRDVTDKIESSLLNDGKLAIALIGASGVGKTTAARQALAGLSAKAGWFTWEHKEDLPFLHTRWRDAARELAKNGTHGVLLIDNAPNDLPEINDLVDLLANEKLTSLRLILCASPNQWHPRVKTPHLYKQGVEYSLSRISANEIDRLLSLVETDAQLRPLVEADFLGYSRSEKRQRLVDTCSADMFVCLRRIFSSESFDDIVLREYAELADAEREIYRVIAAMESTGVHVHRQLVIRLLSINADAVAGTLNRLSGIIEESTVSERQGIYAWFGRHRVIMNIIARHKYFDKVQRFELISNVIDAVQPTYDIEIRTLKELCSVETGIPSIPSRDDQNLLLRKMISVAPGTRVPRHRLIRNLVELGKYDQAEAEIRTFKNDFGFDGPVTRYRINLATARAMNSPGLLLEDRIYIINEAKELAASAASKYRDNKFILTAYCEVGVAAFKLGLGRDLFDLAIAEFRRAEERNGDPDIQRAISIIDRRFERALRDGPDAVDLDFSE